jgi:Ca2+ transporting ATPase
MVTGDILDTAVAISKDAGIISQDFDMTKNEFTVMEGKKFREFVGGLKKVADPDNPKVEKSEVADLVKFRKVAD